MQLLQISESSQTIFYHGSDYANFKSINAKGLYTEYSRSPQNGVYVALDPSMAMAVAENLSTDIGRLVLVMIEVGPDVILHPDEDTFIYDEILDGLSPDIINKLFKSDYGLPSSIINTALQSDEDPAFGLAEKLTIRPEALKQFAGTLSNAVYHGNIGFNGDPKIIDVGDYVLQDNIWILQQSKTGRLQQTINRY